MRLIWGALRRGREGCEWVAVVLLKPVECDPSPRPEGPEGWCGVEGCSYLHQHQGASFPRASGSVLGKGRRWTGLASGEGEAGMGMATPTLPNRAGTSLGIRMKALVPLPSGEQFSHSCALGAPRPRCPPQLFPPCTCPGPEITQPFDGSTGMGWTWICSTGPVTSPPGQVRTAGSSNGHLSPVELTLDLCRDDTWGPGMWRASWRLPLRPMDTGIVPGRGHSGYFLRGILRDGGSGRLDLPWSPVVWPCGFCVGKLRTDGNGGQQGLVSPGHPEGAKHFTDSW